MIEQLTVFLENSEGRLASAVRTIADAGINMRAMFLADTEDFGVARIFCDTPHAAAEALKAAGYRAAITEVLGVHVPNEVGGLAKLLEFLNESNINIEYGYCFVDGDVAVDVLKVSDEGVEEKLAAAGFTIADPKDVYVAD